MAEECTRHFVSPWVIAVASLCATVMVGVCMYPWYCSCVEVKQQHMLELYTLCCQLCAWKLFVLVQNRNLLKPTWQVFRYCLSMSQQTILHESEFIVLVFERTLCHNTTQCLWYSALHRSIVGGT